MGIAVDANVLIFERIKEELRNGVSPQAAISSGYDKALSTIADANITTLIAATMLFIFGTGPIKGFAITLSLGILSSMFTSIIVTRALVNGIYGGRTLSKLSIGGGRSYQRAQKSGCAVMSKARSVAKASALRNQINFMGQRRITTTLSIVLILVSLVSLGTRGLNFGIDFTGGVLLEAEYPQAADLGSIRADLASNDFAAAQVQNFGNVRDVLIRVLPLEGVNNGQLGEQILSILQSSEPAVALRRIEFVGPQVGEELTEQGGVGDDLCAAADPCVHHVQISVEVCCRLRNRIGGTMLLLRSVYFRYCRYPSIFRC